MNHLPLEEVRRLCLEFPGATERLSHSAPSFFGRTKKCFVIFHDNHHNDGRLAIWCAAPWGAQEAMVQSRPETFFVPPYVGHRGWIGVRLEGSPDWLEVAEFIADAHACVSPARTPQTV